MADIGSAAARGLESGFGMGLRLDAANEEKRARKFQEGRQLEIDRRSDEDLKLRREREDRQERRLEEGERLGRQDRAYRYGKERQNELVTAATRAQESGGPIPPDVVEEYGRNAQSLARVRQDALNYFSRLQTGQEKMEDTEPGALYMNFTAATGRRPEDAPQVQQAINDVQAGLETGNQGLVLQGVNGVMAPQLKKGIGEPSPHGGKIVRKEIIGLDPARSADGRDHPDKFIPRLRVYVEKDGKTQYYDAPVTKNRSTDPNDPVVAVGIDKALDQLGNLGVLMAAMEHPEVKAKLAEGAKLKGNDAQKYLDELTMASRPTKKVASRERVDLGDRVVERELDSTGKVVKETELKKGAAPRVFPPARGGSGASTMRAGLVAVDEALEAGEITEEEANEERRAIRSKIRPGAGGKGKGPSNAELNATEQKALDAVGGELGLEYDLTNKVYRNRDGTPATVEQKERMGKAKEAITRTSRDAAAGGKRTEGSALIDTGKGAAGKAKPTYKEGQTATGPNGQKLVFKGGQWQPLR